LHYALIEWGLCWVKTKSLDPGKTFSIKGKGKLAHLQDCHDLFCKSDKLPIISTSFAKAKEVVNVSVNIKEIFNKNFICFSILNTK